MLYSTVQPMHIPDGFLSVPVSIVLWLISIVLIAIALKNVRHELGDKQVPLMGVLAATIFAGQMLNFSVTGGTSGHLLGAALATILLGPWSAVIVMTSVVSVQALLFQDGGILALGANIFNMAIIGVFISFFVFRLLKSITGKSRVALFISGFVTAWTTIFFASLACAIQLALSGTSPANIAILAMAAIHALIGIGEGLITAGALAFLLAARKDLIESTSGNSSNQAGILIGGGLIAVVLAVLSPIASSNPDGLEWFAEQQGFLGAAQDSLYSIMPDYVMPGINDPTLATIIAGIIGVVIVFGVSFGIARSDNKVPVREEVPD